MSDDREPPAEPTVVALEQKPNELLGWIENQLRVMRKMAEHSKEIAEHRKRMFDAYVAAGFDPSMALDLIKGNLY